MPRSAQVNREIRDARREEILAAAIRVFADKGFASAKIADIAADAKLSHGLVYHYFESKEAVFAAIVDGMFDQIRRDIASLPGKTAWERIEAGVALAIRRLDVQPQVGGIVCQTLMLGALPGTMHARIREHVEQIHQHWVRLIRQGQKEGSVTDEATAADLAAALVSMIRGFSMRVPGMPELPFAPPTSNTMLRLLRPARRGSNGSRKH